MSWNHRDEFEIKFKENVFMNNGLHRRYKFNKGDILIGKSNGYCGSYNSEDGHIEIILHEDKHKIDSIDVYYKNMEYIINKTSNEYVYFNEDGTVKETNHKKEYDYFIAGISCYDYEYPSYI